MRLHRFLVVLLIASIATLANADGTFFGPQKESAPSIPYQRGLVVYRHGVETLVVESVLNAPKDSYGWVVPVPHPPSAVKVLSPGAMESLSETVTPHIVGRIGALGLSSGLILLFVLATVFFYKPGIKKPNSGYLSNIAISSVVIFIIGVGASMFGTYAGSSGSPRLSVQNLGSIGPYQVEILRPGGGSSDVYRWLAAHHFELRPRASEAIEAYSRKGWSFVAAKLTHDGGAATPPPLQITFTSEQAVYPLSLTAAQSTPLQLDLFTVSDLSPNVSGLQFMVQTQARMLAPEAIEGAAHRGALWEPISHPDIIPLLWEGALITRFRGTLDAVQMRDDMVVSFGQLAPVPPVLYSKESSRDETLQWGLVMTFGIALIGGVGASALGWRRSRHLAFLFGAFLAAGLFLCVRYLRMQVLDAQTTFYHQSPEWILERWKPVGHFPETLESAVYSDRHVSHRDQPVGCVFTKIPHGWKVTAYGRHAEPTTYFFDESGWTMTPK
jgi:hypothetical protein